MADKPEEITKLSSFLTEVKEIEKRDSVFTPEVQIARLLKPGSSYFNLNPYEVLQIDPDTPMEQMKKQYRKLSFLVHPDKNQDDKERAQKAFDAVNRAQQMLQDEKQLKRCQEIIQEAREKRDYLLEEKRKKLKKEGKIPEEDTDPMKKKHMLWVQTCKLFADYERQKKALEERDMQERKRLREQEIEEEEKAKKQKEWNKQWEEKRDERVDSWRSWQGGSTKSSKKQKKHTKGVFKPPKLKPEQR